MINTVPKLNLKLMSNQEETKAEPQQAQQAQQFLQVPKVNIQAAPAKAA